MSDKWAIFIISSAKNERYIYYTFCQQCCRHAHENGIFILFSYYGICNSSIKFIVGYQKSHWGGILSHCGHFELPSRLPQARQDVELSKHLHNAVFWYVFDPMVWNIKWIGWRLVCLVQSTRQRKTIANKIWLPTCRGVWKPLVQSCNYYILNFSTVDSLIR